MIGPAVQLGRLEAARVIRNPFLWASFLPALVWAALADNAVDEHFLLSGYGLVLAWFAAMAITAVAARRTRDQQVRQGLDVLPLGSDTRTLGVGFGAAGTLLTATVITVLIWVIRWPEAFLGTTVDTVPRGVPVPRPTLAQFAQGPLVMLVFAMIGLVIGRWVPSWLLVPALFVPIVVQFLWFGVWVSGGTPWFSWLLPMATGWVSSTEWVGPCDSSVAVCDLQLSGFDRVTPWWHAAYLIALALLLASCAVALDGGKAARRWFGAAAITTIALGAIQVLTYERWHS